MRWRLAFSALALALALATSGVAAAPREGRYEARLCVTTQAGATPNCGAAEAELRRGGRLELRVSDIVYRLALRDAQLKVTTMHGRMQIDEFAAPYEWAGDVLRFSDSVKDVRYEVHLSPRRR